MHFHTFWTCFSHETNHTTWRLDLVNMTLHHWRLSWYLSLSQSLPARPWMVQGCGCIMDTSCSSSRKDPDRPVLFNLWGGCIHSKPHKHIDFRWFVVYLFFHFLLFKKNYTLCFDNILFLPNSSNVFPTSIPTQLHVFLFLKGKKKQN